MSAKHPIYRLTLEKSYYAKGFFNIPVAFDGCIRDSDGPVTLVLGGLEIETQVTRKANANGTARLKARARLRDWFQQNFSLGDTVRVTFVSPCELLLD